MLRVPFRSLLALASLSLVLAACGGSAPASPVGEATSAPAAATSAPVEATTAPAEATAPAAATPAAAEPTAAAATPAAAEPTTAATTDPKETLVFAGDLSDQISFDPAVAYETGGILVVGHVYQTLVTIQPGESTVKPLLAKSWDVKDTGDTWTLTFALDEKAKFASGNPVTADDVVYSWGRVIDLNKAPAFLFNDVAGLKKDSFKAVDKQTLQVTLAKTTSPQVFLSVLSFSVAAVIEQAALTPNAGSDNGSAWLNDHSAGSGPYVLESWERNTQNTLNLNPNYWGTAPAIKRLILRNVTELANLQSAIETGEADIVSGLGSEQVTALQANPDVQIVKGASTGLVYAGMNATVPPLDKVDVRQAIRYAINYDDINTLLGGNGKIVQEIIPDGLLGHTGENPFKQDIAKAKALVAKAGVADGTEVEFMIPAGPAPGGVEWSTIAAAIQSNVAQIGIKLTIKQVQQSELLTAYRAQKGQMVLISWGPDYPDPDGNATPLANYDAKSIAWRNAWNSPEISALSKAAAVEQDTAKRVALYKQLTERVLNEGPYAVLYQPTSTYAVRKNISGFVYGPASTPSIWFWTVSKS